MACEECTLQSKRLMTDNGQPQQWQFCAVNVLATFVAIAFVDKVGRRKLLIIASVWMFVTQVIVAGTLGAEFQQHGANLPRGVSIGMLIVRTGLLFTYAGLLKHGSDFLHWLDWHAGDGIDVGAIAKNHSCVFCC